jgi:hypothetical protein
MYVNRYVNIYANIQYLYKHKTEESLLLNKEFTWTNFIAKFKGPPR